VDPLTHGLAGAGLGYAFFGGRLGRAAAAAGALAALLPDVDVFIRSATDPLLAIAHHRGFTHSFAFAPIGAAIVAFVTWSTFGPRRHASLWWWCALTGYVSHCLLDAATSYGTQLLWPFSSYRAGWDLISIVDPVFTLMLAVTIGIGLRRARRTVVVSGLTLALVYLGLGFVQRERAADVQAGLARARGHRRERVEIMPTMGNQIVWRALYEHDGRIYSDRIRVPWFSAPSVREGMSLPVVDARELTPEEVRRDGSTRSFARFQWFSDGWVARDPAHLAVLGDMRYSLSTESFDPVWGIRFTVGEAETPVVWVDRTRERRVEAMDLWREISGRDSRYRRPGS
jgi:inner membrane protein